MENLHGDTNSFKSNTPSTQSVDAECAALCVERNREIERLESETVKASEQLESLLRKAGARCPVNEGHPGRLEIVQGRPVWLCLECPKPEPMAVRELFDFLRLGGDEKYREILSAACEAKGWQGVPLSAVAARPVEMMIPGFLVQGMIQEVVGLPGTGKGVLLATAAAALTRGEAWRNRPAERAAVIWISAEDSRAHVLRPRIEIAGGDLDLVETPEHPQGEIIAFPSGAPVLRGLIERWRARGLFVLVVLDPIEALLDGGIKAHVGADVCQGTPKTIALGTPMPIA